MCVCVTLYIPSMHSSKICKPNFNVSDFRNHNTLLEVHPVVTRQLGIRASRIGGHGN